MVFSGFPRGSVVKNSPATGVQSLIWEDQNAEDQQVRGPQLLNLCSWVWELQLLKPAGPRVHAPRQEKPLQWKACAPQIASIRARWSRICKPMRGTRDGVRLLGGKDPWEKEMATHSGILAWKIPWTEEPGGLHMGVAKSWTRLSMHLLT